MKAPKIYTIQADNTWESIPTIQDQEGFIFRPDADIEFAESNNPAIDEIIPVVAEKQNKFIKPTSFWIRGTAGTKFYIAPFDGVIGGSGGAPTTSADLVSQITLVAGIDKVVSHNLGSQNMHITVLQDDEPVEISVSDITENEITLSSLNSGNYILLLTKLDSAYGNNFGMISGIDGINIVNFDTMEELSTINIAGETISGGTFIDNFYFVVNRTTGFLHKYDIYTGLDVMTPVQISVGGTLGIILTDFVNLYIFDSTLDRITKFEIATESIIGFVTTVDYLYSGIVDLDLGKIYATSFDLAGGRSAGSLQSLDLPTFVLTNVGTVANAGGVEFDDNYIYVADQGYGIIHRTPRLIPGIYTNIDLSVFSMGVLKRIGTDLYVGGYNNGRIIKMDLTSRGTFVTLLVSGDAYYFAEARDKLMFISYVNTYLGEMDIATFTLTARTFATLPSPTLLKNFN